MQHLSIKTMTALTEKKADSLLFKFRKQDTPTGVSSSTVEQMAKVIGLSKTAVVHLALRELADKCLPRYERDDGPLTDNQLLLIRNASPATNTPDERFTKLF
jgi:hypothetical protein